MVKIENIGNFKSLGKQKKKKQIILCHTSREIGEYLISLKFRHNERYNKIPNFIITKDGEINQLLPEIGHSNFFHDININRNSIIVSLENLGWLEKKPLSNHYISWNKTIYNKNVFEKKWRDFFYWDPYSEIQIEKTAELCGQLINTLGIKKRCIGHNTKFDETVDFEGIVSRSNYDTRFTDLNPSFDFEKFTNYLKYEQFA